MIKVVKVIVEAIVVLLYAGILVAFGFSMYGMFVYIIPSFNRYFKKLEQIEKDMKATGKTSISQEEYLSYFGIKIVHLSEEEWQQKYGANS